MGCLIAAWLLGAGVPAALPGEPTLKRFQFTQVEMAVPIRIVLYAPDSESASRAADAAFARIAALNSILSDYDPQSELRRLCDSTSKVGAVPVSEDLWKVLAHAQVISKQSEGAFDVTVGPVVRLWRRARRRKQLPPHEQLQSARKLVDYRLIRLNAKDRTVELLRPEMQLDLGGIAKGYVADEALAVLKKSGVNRAMIDAGGDILLGDPPPDKPGWRIGVARLDAEGPLSRILTLSGVSVATSGDTWQYVELDGRRYSHIVDPRTGLGLTDHSSVTVIARDGISADSLASAVSVLGPEKGLKLIENTPGAAVLIVRAPDGKVETYESSRWKNFSVVPAGGN